MEDKYENYAVDYVKMHEDYKKLCLKNKSNYKTIEKILDDVDKNNEELSFLSKCLEAVQDIKKDLR